MESVTLRTADLLSKWGFEDGDVLDDLLSDAGYDRVYWDEKATLPSDEFHFDHRVLLRVVESYVLPAVRQNHDIVTYRIHTIHNPIRAEKVDGIEVRPFDPDFDLPMVPEEVTVPLSAVFAIADEERVRFTVASRSGE